jgi:glycosyltransferase involved in cell wall biosynthesis
MVEWGHEVTIFTRGRGLKTEFETLDGIKVYRLPFLPIPPFHVKFHGYFVNNLLKKMEKQFDLIHLHSPLVPYVKSGLPKVLTLHSLWNAEIRQFPRIEDVYSLYVRLFHKTFRAIENRSMDNADSIITVSEAVKKELKEYGVGIENTTVIWNGVDINMFQRGENPRGKNILFVGRLVTRKGLADLVESAKFVTDHCPDCVFTIVGSGLLEQKLRKRIKQLNLTNHFSFIGNVSQEKLVEYYQKAWVYVLPSYYEGLPKTLLEAMACGLPAIVTNIPGNAEVTLNGVTGLIVPPKNPKELARAINKVLDDGDLRNRMGESGRKRAEEVFTWDAMAKQVIKVYEDLLRR